MSEHLENEVPLIDHPCLQFWPQRWQPDGRGLISVLLARDPKPEALFCYGNRSTKVGVTPYHWAAGDWPAISNQDPGFNARMRAAVLDGRAWLEVWTLWSWGWSMDSTARPGAPLPSPDELDEAVWTVKGLPKGLPLVPNRWAAVGCYL